MHEPKPGQWLEKSENGSVNCECFLTSSLLIYKVDIIHYCNIGCDDRKLEIIEE